MVYSVEDFASKLRMVLGKQGVTVKKLSEQMGCSESTVYKWMAGVTWPSELTRRLLGERLMANKDAFLLPETLRCER